MEEFVNNKIVTVVTPTFNRGNLLSRCYVSLVNQTCKNFKWLIIDDGSTDDTENIVMRWIKDHELDILYLKKNNGGKHRAINFGINYVDSKLTLILDSDDWLTSQAIEKVITLYSEYKNTEGICGFTFLKKYPNDELMGDSFPYEGEYNFIKWRVNGIVRGDQCDVVYTNLLKECPFSEYDDEKYIGESTLWIKLGLKYNMICKNDAIYVADYLEGGLTRNGRLLRIKSARGSMEYANLCIMKECSMKRKIIYSPLYTSYGLIACKKLKTILKESNNKYLVALTMPIGFFIRIFWRFKYKL